MDATKSRNGFTLLRHEPPPTRLAAPEILVLVFHELTRRLRAIRQQLQLHVGATFQRSRQAWTNH